MHEAAQKDMKQSSEVLQACSAIIKHFEWFWKRDDFHALMTACVILYSKIVEDEMQHGQARNEVNFLLCV